MHACEFDVLIWNSCLYICSSYINQEENLFEKITSNYEKEKGTLKKVSFYV